MNAGPLADGKVHTRRLQGCCGGIADAITQSPVTQALTQPITKSVTEVSSAAKEGGSEAASAWKGGGSEAASAWEGGGSEAASAWKGGGNEAASSWKNGGNEAASVWKDGGKEAASAWKGGGNEAASAWKNGGNEAASAWKGLGSEAAAQKNDAASALTTAINSAGNPGTYNAAINDASRAIGSPAGRAVIGGAVDPTVGAAMATGVDPTAAAAAAINNVRGATGSFDKDKANQGIEATLEAGGNVLTATPAAINKADSQLGDLGIGEKVVGQDVDDVNRVIAASKPCQGGQYMTNQGQCAAAVVGCAGGAYVGALTDDADAAALGCSIGESASVAAVNVCGGGAWTTYQKQVKCISGTAEGAGNGVEPGLGTAIVQDCDGGKWTQVQVVSASDYKGQGDGVWYSKCANDAAEMYNALAPAVGTPPVDLSEFGASKDPLKSTPAGPPGGSGNPTVTSNVQEGTKSEVAVATGGTTSNTPGGVGGVHVNPSAELGAALSTKAGSAGNVATAFGSATPSGGDGSGTPVDSSSHFSSGNGGDNSPVSSARQGPGLCSGTAGSLVRPSTILGRAWAIPRSLTQADSVPGGFHESQKQAQIAEM